MTFWADIFAALRWWGVLTALGLIAFPLSSWLFGRLPDRGYAISRLLGLLLTSFFFWLSASLGLNQNNQGGIIISAAAAAGLSFWVAKKGKDSPWEWLRANWRYALLVELLFAALFALWVAARAQNPAITATEKPMDFAFLNAAANSPSYPPLDPWLSGYAISYYYFGYVMVSVLARLAAVSEAVAFNLAIAWLVAGTGLGAFGLVFNLTAAGSHPAGDTPTRLPLARFGVIAALLAAAAVPLAGNGQMLLEILHGNGIGSATFWEWLDVRDISGPPADQPRYVSGDGSPSPSWWWWRSSRPIHETHLSGRPEEGLEPIAEFPAFSFVLGDMHPHVMALPFAFLSLSLALTWFLGRSNPAAAGAERQEDLISWGRRLLHDTGWLRLLLAAVILGGLSFLNTWDVLIHLFIFVTAYVLARWRDLGWSFDRISEGIALGLGIGLLAYLLYLPFYLGFSSQAGPPYILPLLMRPTRLPQLLIIFGRPLLVILPWLVLLLLGSRLRGFLPAVGTAVGLPLGLFLLMLLLTFGLASHAAGLGVIQPVLSDLSLPVPPRPPGAGFNFGWGAAAFADLLPVLLSVRRAFPGVTILLALVLGAVVWVWSDRFSTDSKKRADAPDLDRLPFALLLVFTAGLLVLGPEFVFLRDNFGQRLNTIFKFYYQAWLLLGTAASFALAYLWRRVRPLGLATGLLYVGLLAIGLLFPLRAVQSRSVEYRGPASLTERPAPTLDGLAFLARSNPADYEAIQWLKTRVPAGSVVLEATGDPYSYYGRVSANTGLPTVLGWANHEFQWRGSSTDEPGRRISLVSDLFNGRDWVETSRSLDALGVDYIFIGSLERQIYDGRGLQKFADHLTPVYQNDQVVIYAYTAGRQN